MTRHNFTPKESAVQLEARLENLLRNPPPMKEGVEKLTLTASLLIQLVIVRIARERGLDQAKTAARCFQTQAAACYETHPVVAELAEAERESKTSNRH